MKKILTTTLLCLALLLVLTACGAQAAQTEPGAGAAAASTTLSAPAGGTAATGELQPTIAPVQQIAAADADAQLSLIFSHLSEFRQDGKDTEWHYAVTDLDHNGRLELIAASVHPVDRSTNVYLWEVNEKGDALAPCKVDLEAEDSFPDISSDAADTFYEAASSQWAYLFYDTIVLSAQDVYTVKCSVTLEKGVLSYRQYALEHAEGAPGSVKVTHLDNDGKEISSEDYDAAGVSAFSGWAKGSTNFKWFRFEDASLAQLTDSYAVFAGSKRPEKEPTKPSPSPSPDPSPAPSPSPTPVPIYLMITKNPSNETHYTGETAVFIADASNWNGINWTFVSPDGREYPVNTFRSYFPGCAVSGDYYTTLCISNVVPEMNWWGVYATFTYGQQVGRTSTAYLYVSDPPPSPTVKPTEPTYNQMNGVVSDYLMSTVTMYLDNGSTLQVIKDICSINGSLYVGAPCVVYYTGDKPTQDSVYYVEIEGEPDPPVPTYGSIAATIHDIGSSRYTLNLNNGNVVTVSPSIVTLLYGDLAEGCNCVAYFEDAPDEDGIYSVEVNGVTKGLIVPDNVDAPADVEAPDDVDLVDVGGTETEGGDEAEGENG